MWHRLVVSRLPPSPKIVFSNIRQIDTSFKKPSLCDLDVLQRIMDFSWPIQYYTLPPNIIETDLVDPLVDSRFGKVRW